MNRCLAMLSSAEIATIRAEIERLDGALKNCADGGLRKWIEAAIEEQKRKLAIQCSAPPSPSKLATFANET